MPDNKGNGWRKKIQGKPKEAAPARASQEETLRSEESERRRHGWRKTLHGSRPVTPITVPMTPVTADTEDARSEDSEDATPRRNSRPKLTRYTSLLSNYMDIAKRPEARKGPEFAEPWSEDAPPPLEPYVDPLVALQSIRSYMLSASLKPIPLEHNSSLFCIFEDYRKTRAQNESLKGLLHDKTRALDKLSEHCTIRERKYEAEIRRLELLIAGGSTGIAGVINARHGSIIKRKYGKIESKNPVLPYESRTSEESDAEILMRSQNVRLQLPTSPSGRMAALSRQLTGKQTAVLSVGSAPRKSIKTILSRKVRSEFDLLSLAAVDTIASVADSDTSDFSAGDIGDLLPDELPASWRSISPETTLEREAFTALAELATLIARRKNVKAKNFVTGLMLLFEELQHSAHPRNEVLAEKVPIREEIVATTSDAALDTTPRPTLRRFQSQPYLSTDQNRRRHFSFEPGQDHLQESRKETHHSEVNMSCASQDDDDGDVLAIPCGGLTSSCQGLSPDLSKASKIPSPVQPLGRVRSMHREGSIASLRSTPASPSEERRGSRSSILTAYRNDLSGDMQSCSTNGKTSSLNARGAGGLPPLRSQRAMGGSVGMIAAARAADMLDRAAVSQGSSPTKSNDRTSVAGASIRLARGSQSTGCGSTPNEELQCCGRTTENGTRPHGAKSDNICPVLQRGGKHSD